METRIEAMGKAISPSRAEKNWEEHYFLGGITAKEGEHVA